MSRRQLSPATVVVAILLIPLAVPVLFVLLGPSANRVRAQELGPKQALVPPSRKAETPANPGDAARQAAMARSRTKNTAATPAQKPSGKMAFYADSPTPRGNRTPAPTRSAANAVVRRQGPDQPAKIAAAVPKRSAARHSKTSSINTLPTPMPEPVTESMVEAVSEPVPTPVVKKEWEVPDREPAPAQVARKELEIPDQDPVEGPEVVASSQPEPQRQFSERPEPSMPEFELPIVRTPQRPAKMLDEEIVVEEETKPARPSLDVVQLFFEDEAPASDDANETMDLVEGAPAEAMELVESDESTEKPAETIVEPTSATEVQIVAAEESPEEPKANSTATTQDEDVRTPIDIVLAELKPVRSIEIRKAVEVPPLAEMDDPQLREPADQAGAMLRKRPPFKFWPVYRDPWVASRDSFAFHHNPLWFEDPNLERCGRGKGHFTSVSSFLQFNTNIAFLPYRMTAEPWHACVRTLPDCTVCQKFGCDAYLPPWSWRAAAVQAGCIVGFIYAIP